jgi:hypothetical protein
MENGEDNRDDEEMKRYNGGNRWRYGEDNRDDRRWIDTMEEIDADMERIIETMRRWIDTMEEIDADMEKIRETMKERWMEMRRRDNRDGGGEVIDARRMVEKR